MVVDIGKANRSSMLCLTERVTRYSILVTMPEGYDAEAMVAGLINGLDRIPDHRLRSITFDQGSESANWETIADRWWFPRGTDLAGITPAAADHAATIINGQRRRHLDHHSPAALCAAATVQ